MTCITIPNGIICISKRVFKCPFCLQSYQDDNEKYINRCNANKCGYTKIKCFCGETFGMTYDYKGNAVGFKLKEKK